MKQKKYLVTGGLGFIGSALVRRLVKEGNFVRVIDNASRGTILRAKDFAKKIQLITADIRDAGAVLEACKGIDCVCHLAFVNGTEFFYKKPEVVLDVGVKGMVNVIDGCIKENISELALASSSEVYQTPKKIPTREDAEMSIPNPLNPRYSYAAGKITSEIMAINYGRKFLKRVVIFRPHNVYGPDMGFEHVIPQLLMRMKSLIAAGKKNVIDFPLQGTGQETRAFVFVDDFIDGLMLVLEKGEHLGIYNIGTMDEVKIRDVAIKISDYFGIGINIIPGDPAKGGTQRRCPDIAKIKKLGYSPIISLDEGLRITAKWYENAKQQAK